MAGSETPATRAARAAGIAFQVHEYAHDPAAPSFALEAAEALGVDPRHVLKTLIVDRDGALTVCIVPAAGTLNLRALGRRTSLADPARAERATGSVTGAISPLGRRRRLPTLVDDSAAGLPTVHVSGGRHGLETELAPADLVALTGAEVRRLRRRARPPRRLGAARSWHTRCPGRPVPRAPDPFGRGARASTSVTRTTADGRRASSDHATSVVREATRTSRRWCPETPGVLLCVDAHDPSLVARPGAVVSPEPGTNDRRTPVRERTLVTVDAIIEAAGQVFARHGYAAGTTDRIADHAGVSVGTVHEHFPDKDAILVALVERHLDDAQRALTPLLTDLVTQAPAIEDGVARMLRALVGLHRTHPALHRVLFEEAPRPEALRRRLDRTVEAAVQAVQGYLAARPEVVVRDHVVAAELVVQIAESVTHGLVMNPRAGADPDAYVRETERMLVRYLTGR